jgi:hypothetical protein
LQNLAKGGNGCDVFLRWSILFIVVFAIWYLRPATPSSAVSKVGQEIVSSAQRDIGTTKGRVNSVSNRQSRQELISSVSTLQIQKENELKNLLKLTLLLKIGSEKHVHPLRFLQKTDCPI